MWGRLTPFVRNRPGADSCSGGTGEIGSLCLCTVRSYTCESGTGSPSLGLGYPVTLRFGPQCQKAAWNINQKAPLMPLPRIPFSRVAFDVVGPLPRTKSGFKYILTLCAILANTLRHYHFKNIDTMTVASGMG